MEILFLILKIAGILLLILLGIVLFLILSVVFIPVRYRIKGKAESPDKIAGSAVFSWFLHLIHGRVAYDGNEVSVILRIAGIPIDLLKEKKPPGQKKRFRKRRRKKKKRADTQAAEDGPDNREPCAEPAAKNSADDGEPCAEPAAKNSADDGETCLSELEEAGAGIELKPEKANNALEHSVSIPSKQFKQKERRRKKRKKHSLKQLISGIKMIPQKVRRFFQNLKTRTSSLKERFFDIKSILSEETNKNAVFFLWKEFKFLLRHYSPRKASGRIAYGTEDPALTGQILGAASLFPFWHRYRISVEPDFYADTFYANGEILLKGRIRALHFLRSGIRLIKNKDLRKLINHFRT